MGIKYKSNKSNDNKRFMERNMAGDIVLKLVGADGEAYCPSTKQIEVKSIGYEIYQR